MGLRRFWIPLAEFVGGLVTLRVAMPADSVMLAFVGLGLTLVGASGLLRPLSKVQARPYLQEEPQA